MAGEGHVRVNRLNSRAPIYAYTEHAYDACIYSEYIEADSSATFSDKYRWLNFMRSLSWCNPVDK